MSWPTLVERMDRQILKHMGVAIQYIPSVGQPVDLPKAIYDDAYLRVEAGEAGVQSQTPMVFCRLSDLPTDPQQDDPDVLVGDQRFRVVEVQKDGQGGVRLLLHRSP